MRTPERERVYEKIDYCRDAVDRMRDSGHFASVQPDLATELLIIERFLELAKLCAVHGKGPHGTITEHHTSRVGGTGIKVDQDARYYLVSVATMAVRALETHGLA